MTKDSGSVLLAGGDTWNISGPTFLKLFLVLECAAVLWTFVLRHRLLNAPPDAKAASISTPPTPMELAFLRDTGGPTLVAMTTLHNLGIIDSNGYQRRLPTPGDDLDEVTSRVLTDIQTYRTDPRPVQHPLNRLNSVIGDQIRARGWMFSDRHYKALRFSLWPLVVVAALGILRIIAGLENGKAVGLLLLLLVLLIVPVPFALQTPRLTAAGQKVLTQYQRQYSYLGPHNRPSLTTYGSEALVFSTALFGAGALMFYDPAFASADIVSSTEASRAARNGGSGSFWNSSGCGSDGGGGSCGGGGGCGGGGCGG